MPSYAGSTRHVDRPLSNYALAYENHELIGLKFMPEVKVEKPSDKYFIRSKANQIQAMDLKITGLEIPPEIDQGSTLASFSCQDYGATAKISGRDEAEQDLPINMRQDATLDATALVRLAQEIRIASLMTTTTNYDSGNRVTLSGSDQWDSSGGGDPLGVIDQYRATIWPSPNGKIVAGCDEKTWRVLKRHPQIIDLIKGGATTGTPAMVMKKLFAELIECDEFYVGQAWKNAVNPSATVAPTRVWPKAFMMARVSNNPSTRSMQFASNFKWVDLEVSSWFDQRPGLKGAVYFKAVHSTDERGVASDAGALVTNPVS